MTARSVTARPIPRAVIANPPHHPVIASPPLHPVIASPKGAAIQGRWGDLVGWKGKTLDCRVGCASSQ
jgi:hypothetical protein